MNRYQRVERQVMGDRLRRALAAAGLSPTQVAAELGYTTAGIAHWISGRGEIPAGYLPALAQMTGKPIPYFLGLDASQGTSSNPSPSAGVSPTSAPWRILGPELAFARGLGDLASTQGLELDVEVVAYREALPPEPIVTLLGIPPDRPALYRARVQKMNAHAVRWIGSWMPLDLFGSIADQRPVSRALFDLFEERTGIHITHVEERIRVMPAEAVAMHDTLGISAEEALMAIQRRVHTSIDRIAEFAMIYARPSYWELAYRYPSGPRMAPPSWTWVDGKIEPVTSTQT